MWERRYSEAFVLIMNMNICTCRRSSTVSGAGAVWAVFGETPDSAAVVHPPTPERSSLSPHISFSGGSLQANVTNIKPLQKGARVEESNVGPLAFFFFPPLSSVSLLFFSSFCRSYNILVVVVLGDGYVQWEELVIWLESSEQHITCGPTLPYHHRLCQRLQRFRQLQAGII